MKVLKDERAFSAVELVSALVIMTLVVLAGLLVYKAQHKTKNVPNYHSISNAVDNKQVAVNQSNNSAESKFNVGYCAANPSVTVGCRYTSKDDNYTVTFPANQDFAGTPSIFYHPEGGYVNNQAKAKFISSGTGYELAIFYFSDTLTDPGAIQQRLQASANNIPPNGICTYSPDSDAIHETTKPTTYNNLPALDFNTSGVSDIFKKTCNYYSLSIMKGSLVYVLSATDSASDKYRLSQADFDKFKAGFQFNN